MIKEFYLVFDDNKIDASSLKHIQYSILKNLLKLSYVTYRRIDIFLSFNLDMGYIDWMTKDQKIVRAKCGINNIVDEVLSPEGIRIIYDVVIDCLQKLWKENEWDEKDIVELYEESKVDGYFPTVIIGKTLFSSDKKTKAEFSCDIFPDHADYYISFFAKGKTPFNKIRFFCGLTRTDYVF